MDASYEIEKLFNDEVREKKRVGYGAYHMTGHGVKNGIRGGMKTPVDYLRGKAKKMYMGNGEIRVSNIYSELKKVPSLKELKEMDKEVAKGIIVTARQFHKVDELCKHWDISDNTYYTSVTKDFDITTRPHYGGRKKKDSSVKNESNKLQVVQQALEPKVSEHNVVTYVSETEMLKKQIEELKMQLEAERAKKDLFHVGFRGILDGNEAYVRLRECIHLGYPDKLYEIVFSMQELPKSHSAYEDFEADENIENTSDDVNKIAGQ